MALKDSIINLVLKGRDLISPATKTAAESVGKLQERSEELSAALEKLNTTERQIQQFRKLGAESGRLAENWKQAEAEVKRLKEAFEQAEKPTKSMARELERAEKTAQGAAQAWTRNRDSLGNLTPKLQAAGVNLEQLDQSQEAVQQSALKMRSDLTAVNTQLDREKQAADEAAAKTEAFGKKVEAATGLIGKLGSVLKVVAAGATALVAGIGASAATLTVFSRSQAKLADDLTNTANAIGINREQLQLWQIAGERVGLSGEKVSDILRSVVERLGEFSANGGGEAADVMERLNLKIEDFEGMAPDQQMLKFAKAIESLPKTEQVALLEMLASDASQLQPLLENNAAGLKAIAREADQTGAIYSNEDLDKLVKANDIYNKITLKIQGLTRQLGAELAPVVADATDKLADLFDQNELGQKLAGIFKQLIQGGAELAARLVENSDSISRGFGTLWDTLQAGVSGAIALFRSLQTVAAGVLTVVSTGFAGLLSIAQGVTYALNQIGAVSDEAYNGIRAKAEAARATTVALAQETARYGKAAADAGKDVVDAFDNGADAAKRLGDEAKKGVGTLTSLADSIKPVEDATESARASAKKLTDAFDELGVDSQKALQEAADKAEKSFKTISESGIATKEDIEAAFKAYAEKVIATGDKARIKALEARAAVLGLRDALKDVQQQQTENTADISAPITAAGEEAEKATPKIRNMADTIGDNSDAADEFREKWQAAWGGAFAKALSNAREKVSALSVAARNLFEMKIGGNQFVGQVESASEALERARARVTELAEARRRLMSSSLAAWFADTALAAAEVEERFYGQAVALERLQGQIENGQYGLQQLADISKTAANRFDLLDQQRLSGLQGAIDAARQKLQSLTDTADSTLSSLQQRLADIRGDTEEAQRIQYEQERKRLEEQLAQAKQAGATEAAADYQQSLDTLSKIYAIEQRNRQEEQNAREKAAADRAREQQAAEQQRQQTAAALDRPTTSAAAPPPARTIVLQGPNGKQANVAVTADQESNLLDVLEELGYRSNP